MATASVSITPECSICFEIFENPKVLPCGHTYCLSCIERYICEKKRTFPCPICQQDVKIPQGGAGMFTTNFMLQTSPQTTKVTGKPTSPTTKVTGKPTSPTTQVTATPTSLRTQVTGTRTSPQTSEVAYQPHHCPNHSKKEVEYYCQTCNLGLCSKCIYRDHNDHKTLDLECDSTKEMVVGELSKSEEFIKKKIEGLEVTYAKLLDTSEKLKSLCDDACTKIGEKTERIIGELKENCEKRQKGFRDHFDKNESQLTETRQKVMTQIENIKTDLDTSCPTTTEEPSLTLIYSLTKLQDLQKHCENMKTDIPPVTYVEWREGSVKVCDILGSTVIKPLQVYSPRADGWGYPGQGEDEGTTLADGWGYPGQGEDEGTTLADGWGYPGQGEDEGTTLADGWGYPGQGEDEGTTLPDGWRYPGQGEEERTTLAGRMKNRRWEGSPTCGHINTELFDCDAELSASYEDDIYGGCGVNRGIIDQSRDYDRTDRGQRRGLNKYNRGISIRFTELNCGPGSEQDYDINRDVRGQRSDLNRDVRGQRRDLNRDDRGQRRDINRDVRGKIQLKQRR